MSHKKPGLRDTEIWQADSNEAGLRTDMVSAIRASHEFAKWLFNTVSPNSKEVNLTANPHVEQRLYNSIIDIDLQFKGQASYRFGIELKNGTSDVYREQLERHLVGLKIMQKKRRVLTKFASNETRIVKLVVITGSSKEPSSVRELLSIRGFEDKIVWISWHKIVDAIGRLPSVDQKNPNVKPLVDILKRMGFSSKSSVFPRFNTINKVSKLIGDIKPLLIELNDELEVLDAILQRVDYEMNTLNYRPSQSMKVIKLARGKIDKKFTNFLPSKLTRKIERTTLSRWIGRLYVPNEEILALSNLEESKSILFGIAIGYDIEDRSWFCHIEPKPKSPINETIFTNIKFKSNERIPRVSRNGWELKGTQLNPTKTSKFMTAVWENYCMSN